MRSIRLVLFWIIWKFVSFQISAEIHSDMIYNDDDDAEFMWSYASLLRLPSWNCVLFIGCCYLWAGLDISSKNLRGELQSTICGLSSLVSLELQDNFLQGSVPEMMIFNCTKLQHLDLSSNNLSGSLVPPPKRHNISGPRPGEQRGFFLLKYLNLSLNVFQGPISSEIGKLSELEVLDMVASGVDGSIPDEIGILDKLTNLSLSWNNFDPGMRFLFFPVSEVWMFKAQFQCRWVGTTGTRWDSFSQQ